MRKKALVTGSCGLIGSEVSIHLARNSYNVDNVDNRAASIPFDDADTNAVGTLNLLGAARQACSESPFIHRSTNKVDGDLPNSIRLKELASRWDYDDPAFTAFPKPSPPITSPPGTPGSGN